MKNVIFTFLLVVTSLSFGQGESDNKGAAPLDKGLRPSTSDEVTSLFDNVVAVQRKAKQKSGKILFSPRFSFDFSDAAFTMYNLNLSLGYGLGEFWEFYLSYSPSYVSNERNISKQVKSLQLQNGQQASIETEKAKNSYGLEINWVPIYGKDSWGPYGIVRSDTLIHLGYRRIKFEQNSGSQISLLLGKTFFFDDYWNLRIQAGPSSVDTFSQGQKKNIIIGLIDVGLVFYF